MRPAGASCCRWVGPWHRRCVFSCLTCGVAQEEAYNSALRRTCGRVGAHRTAFTGCYTSLPFLKAQLFLPSPPPPSPKPRMPALLQSTLLKLDWPPALLEHPLCQPRPLLPMASVTRGLGGPGAPGLGLPPATPGQAHAQQQQQLVLFKGLSVRMGAATGVPSAIREHPVTRRLQYTGTLLRLATAIADMGGGGGTVSWLLRCSGRRGTRPRA